MNLQKIHHVAIIASDYQKSRNFVETLGFEVIRKTAPRPQRLQAGPQTGRLRGWNSSAFPEAPSV